MTCCDATGVGVQYKQKYLSTSFHDDRKKLTFSQTHNVSNNGIISSFAFHCFLAVLFINYFSPYDVRKYEMRFRFADIITGRNEVVAKVIFLQASVCPQGSVLNPGGLYLVPGRGYLVPGGMVGGGCGPGGCNLGGVVLAPPHFFLIF